MACPAGASCRDVCTCGGQLPLDRNACTTGWVSGKFSHLARHISKVVQATKTWSRRGDCFCEPARPLDEFTSSRDPSGHRGNTNCSEHLLNRDHIHGGDKTCVRHCAILTGFHVPLPSNS